MIVRLIGPDRLVRPPGRAIQSLLVFGLLRAPDRPQTPPAAPRLEFLDALREDRDTELKRINE